jgi:hypothetical protein
MFLTASAADAAAVTRAVRLNRSKTSLKSLCAKASARRTDVRSFALSRRQETS